MKRKALILCLLAALILSAAAGCGKKKTEPVPTEAPTVTPAPTIDPHEGMIEVDDGNGGTMWIEESEILSAFPLDRNAIAVSNDSAMYNGTGWYMRRGVDVSAYQNEIDWDAVAASGIDFAFIRCGWRGYSNGVLNEDAYFTSNLEAAQAAGLDVGIYFFSQATSVIEAAEEAVYTAKLLEGYTLQLPVFFDWELIDGADARTDDMDGELLTDCALEYCRLLQSAGYEAGIYTNLHLAYLYYDLDALAELPIWFAGPNSSPCFYYDHQFWQYDFHGQVDGIPTEVDLDVMYVRGSAPATAAPAQSDETATTEEAEDSADSTEETESTESSSTEEAQAVRE